MVNDIETIFEISLVNDIENTFEISLVNDIENTFKHLWSMILTTHLKHLWSMILKTYLKYLWSTKVTTRHLPELNGPRVLHACGMYESKQEKVLEKQKQKLFDLITIGSG